MRKHKKKIKVKRSQGLLMQSRMKLSFVPVGVQIEGPENFSNSPPPRGRGDS